MRCDVKADGLPQLICSCQCEYSVVEAQSLDAKIQRHGSSRQWADDFAHRQDLAAAFDRR